MRMQSTVTIYGIEIKGEAEFNGQKFPPSSVFHLDADIAQRTNGKTFGIVTRPHKMAPEIGKSFEHLGNSLPVQAEAVFDAVASPTGIQLKLVEIKPLKKA